MTQESEAGLPALIPFSIPEYGIKLRKPANWNLETANYPDSAAIRLAENLSTPQSDYPTQLQIEIAHDVTRTLRARSAKHIADHYPVMKRQDLIPQGEIVSGQEGPLVWSRRKYKTEHQGKIIRHNLGNSSLIYEDLYNPNGLFIYQMITANINTDTVYFATFSHRGAENTPQTIMGVHMICGLNYDPNR